jgi:hypothetical protein
VGPLSWERSWGQPSCGCGVALIILGVLALASEGITYTTREKVIDLGPLKASVDAVRAAEHHSSLEARSPEPSRCSRGSRGPKLNGEFRCCY